MKIKTLLLLLLLAAPAAAQVTNTAVMDTTDFNRRGKVTVEGYIDAYYAYDFNLPKDHTSPYFVSMNRHNEITVNLAFVDLKYSSSRLRARFVPAYGTFMNANYQNETGSLKNILEASIGIRVSEKKNIWLDAGVFGSPYTNESALSKDHLTYTRSLAPEFVPYYLSGVRVTFPLHKKWNAYVYLLNGWQQIQDQNDNKAIGTQLEFRPNDYWLLNWNTYTGKDPAASDSVSGARFFSDFYFIFNKNRWSVTSCIYGGVQRRDEQDGYWWQANVIGRYRMSDVLSLAARVEYFSDPHQIQVVPITAAKDFSCFGSSVGLNVQPDTNILIRTEVRWLSSREPVFTRDDINTDQRVTATTSITIWF